MECTVSSCDRPRRSKGQILCHGHQSQKQRGKPFSPLGARPRRNNEPLGETKRCPRCSSDKPRADFHKNKATTDGLCTYCRSCSSKYEKDRWHKRKPVAQARYFRQTYNLTPNDIELMLHAQGGVCAICGQKPNRRVVDHCHDSGKVRGVLCDTCNRCLGLLKDDANVLLSAAAYLLQHEDVISKVGA